MKRRSKLEIMTSHRISAFNRGVGEKLESTHGIDFGNHQLVDEIATALVQSNVGLFETWIGLISTGDEAEADRVLSNALQRLKDADPLVFRPAPSRGHLALLIHLTAENVPEDDNATRVMEKMISASGMI